MTGRSIRLALAATACLVVGSTGSVAAGGPIRVSDSYTDTFPDDFILDLCGIETMTTLTERWTFKEYPDGSSTLHVVRTFVPADPRVPIEKGAGSRFTSPDGTSKVVGSPLRIYDRDGGIKVIAAGQAVFDTDGDPIRTRGRFVDLSDAALAGYYCP